MKIIFEKNQLIQQGLFSKKVIQPSEIQMIRYMEDGKYVDLKSGEKVKISQLNIDTSITLYDEFEQYIYDNRIPFDAGEKDATEYYEGDMEKFVPVFLDKIAAECQKIIQKKFGAGYDILLEPQFSGPRNWVVLRIVKGGQHISVMLGGVPGEIIDYMHILFMSKIDPETKGCYYTIDRMLDDDDELRDYLEDRFNEVELIQ